VSLVSLVSLIPVTVNKVPGGIKSITRKLSPAQLEELKKRTKTEKISKLEFPTFSRFSSSKGCNYTPDTKKVDYEAEYKAYISMLKDSHSKTVKTVKAQEVKTEKVKEVKVMYTSPSDKVSTVVYGPITLEEHLSIVNKNKIVVQKSKVVSSWTESLFAEEENAITDLEDKESIEQLKNKEREEKAYEELKVVIASNENGFADDIEKQEKAKIEAEKVRIEDEKAKIEDEKTWTVVGKKSRVSPVNKSVVKSVGNKSVVKSVGNKSVVKSVGNKSVVNYLQTGFSPTSYMDSIAGTRQEVLNQFARPESVKKINSMCNVKTEMCSFFSINPSKCRNHRLGKNCKYAHSEEELYFGCCVYGVNCEKIRIVNGEYVNKLRLCNKLGAGCARTVAEPCNRSHPEETAENIYKRLGEQIPAIPKKVFFVAKPTEIKINPTTFIQDGFFPISKIGVSITSDCPTYASVLGSKVEDLEKAIKMHAEKLEKDQMSAKLKRCLELLNAELIVPELVSVSVPEVEEVEAVSVPVEVPVPAVEVVSERVKQSRRKRWDVGPIEVVPIEVKPIDAVPIEVKPIDAVPIEVKPEQVKLVQKVELVKSMPQVLSRELKSIAVDIRINNYKPSPQILNKLDSELEKQRVSEFERYVSFFEQILKARDRIEYTITPDGTILLKVFHMDKLAISEAMLYVKNSLTNGIKCELVVV
jgi:hypothetical protein